jgi:hypothetical protein
VTRKHRATAQEMAAAEVEIGATMDAAETILLAGLPPMSEAEREAHDEKLSDHLADCVQPGMTVVQLVTAVRATGWPER